jgi:hypothetical protein
MPRPDEYTDNAAQTLLLAQHAANCAEKARLLELAERWLDLADRIATQAKRQVRDAQQWAREFAQRPQS